MFVLYEDSGDFKVGHVMQEAAGNLQVEAPHGKRSKIKANSVLMSFTSPDAAQLMPGAQALQSEFDPAFLWECAPQAEFDFLGFGEEYFGAKPDAVQATALLLALQGAPLYFHRKGRGRFKPAPPDILKAALAAAEKKRLALERQSAWADQMLAGNAPEEIVRVAAGRRGFRMGPSRFPASPEQLAARERTGERIGELFARLGVDPARPGDAAAIGA